MFRLGMLPLQSPYPNRLGPLPLLHQGMHLQPHGPGAVRQSAGLKGRLRLVAALNASKISISKISRKSVRLLISHLCYLDQ